MKTSMKILCSVLLAMALVMTVSAAFTKKNTYGGQFADVKESSWYAKEVAAAYELGFVEGVSENSYSPDTTVTVAQGITMASRVHAEYNGKTIAKVDGGKWYDMYINYAKANGIITENQFDSYTREIKRFEMAEIFHDAMGKEYFTAINDVVFIPDVPMGAMYYDKLLTLYNAGVVMGSDEYGSYKPDDNIKRSECAAIINRVALPENRLNKTLSDFTSGEAYVLCYNEGMDSARTSLGINSGWQLDNRGGVAKTTTEGYGSVGDVSEKYATCYVREFNFIPSGEIVLEITLISQAEGAFLEYRDIEENTVYMLKVVDGKWSVLGKDGKYTAVADTKADNTAIRVSVNLDTGKSKTFVDDKGGVEAELLSDNVLSFRAGIDETGTGSMTVAEIQMTVDYALYENFNFVGTEDVYGWETSGIITTGTQEKQLDINGGSVKKSFDAVSGDVSFETYFFTAYGDDFEMLLGDAVKVESKAGKLYVNSAEMYTLTKNMWYRLRVDADTNEGTAKVWLNGRVKGNVNLLTKNAPSYFSVTAKGSLSLDNMAVYVNPEIKDYVPVPTTRASLDDYITVLNICSLWRNGTHFGWGVVSPYDEPETLLGYYDEGDPETADWEIKWMVEHGIDVQAFCWYADTHTAPLKTPRNSEQLHNGYQLAKYSDMMYYVIIWEAAGAKGLTSEQLRTNTIPYWFENYFLDERYLKIDNKIVLPIYSAMTLVESNNLGSLEAAKAEFNYLEELAKSYGFDGMIYLACGSGYDKASFAQVGFDGGCAYNWSSAGKEYQENVDKNTKAANSAEKNGMYFIPTVSVGFDSIPWHNERKGMMTVEDFKKTSEWIRDTYLPKYSKNVSWADKLVWISTWNEYGEGTYICPAGQNGFGYVDVLRDVFTDLPDSHTDAVPTLVQKERINHLYPQYAKNLARDGEYWYTTEQAERKEAPQNKLFINGIDINSNANPENVIPAKVVDDKPYFAFNPMTGMHYILGVYHEWRKDADTLRILGNGHEVIFEVNSDRYMLDGVEKALGYIVEMSDSLPMLDFVLLAKDLGYKTETKNGDVYVYSDTYEEIWKALAEKKTGGWEFNSYDVEGWASSNMTLIPTGSTVRFFTNDKNTGDPIVMYNQSDFPEDFHTKRYESMEIKFRYDITQATTDPHIKFYYITDVDGNYSEKKTIVIYLDGLSSDGEWITAKVDLKNLEAWQVATALTGLRFDPFNGYGEMEVDYIRFNEDPTYVYVPIEELPMSITNGDAENANLNPFTASSATVSRVEDPENNNNHVWHVKAKEGGKYIYFRYAARYIEGATYRVSFDIKLGENNKNDPALTSSSFCLNLVYPDKNALNEKDHIVNGGNVKISQADGWVHYETTHTIDNLDSKKNAEFTIYMNPVGETGFSYYLDNITIEKLSEEEQMKANPSKYFKWETAKGEVIYDTDEQWNTIEKFSGLTEHKVENGELIMVADDTADPQAYIDGSFDGDKYKLVAVRFKMENVGEERTKSGFKIYFATEADSKLSEKKSANIRTDALIDNGDGYYTAAFHMTNDAWNGKITTIRLDPCDATGTYTIDKVMLVDVN